MNKAVHATSPSSIHTTAHSSQLPSPFAKATAYPVSCDAIQAVNEAISLPDMVHATCIELRPLLAHHQVTLLLNGNAQALPLVFGNRALLRAALWECMEAAVAHARLEVEIERSLAMEVVFSTDTDQVHLTIRNLGAIEVVTLEGANCTHPPHSPHSRPAYVPPETRQHVVFPFARVLLQSLGGQVVVRHEIGAGVECTVSLPRIADSTEATRQATHHAHIYAGLLTRMASNGLETLPRKAG